MVVYYKHLYTFINNIVQLVDVWNPNFSDAPGALREELDLLRAQSLDLQDSERAWQVSFSYPRNSQENPEMVFVAETGYICYLFSCNSM